MSIKVLSVIFIAFFLAYIMGCATQLPIKNKYANISIDSSSPVYPIKQLKLNEIDSFHFPDESYRTIMKAKNEALFLSAYQLSFYLNDLETINDKNKTKQNVYSWFTGIVAGLGGLLAAIDNDREWGPYAGAIGASWALVGLSFEKVSIDPSIDKASRLITKSFEASAISDELENQWINTIKVQSEWDEKFNIDLTKMDDQIKTQYNVVKLHINSEYEKWIILANKVLQKRNEIINMEAMRSK